MKEWQDLKIGDDIYFASEMEGGCPRYGTVKVLDIEDIGKVAHTYYDTVTKQVKTDTRTRYRLKLAATDYYNETSICVLSGQDTAYDFYNSNILYFSAKEKYEEHLTELIDELFGIIHDVQSEIDKIC